MHSFKIPLFSIKFNNLKVATNEYDGPNAECNDRYDKYNGKSQWKIENGRLSKDHGNIRNIKRKNANHQLNGSRRYVIR